MPPLPLCSQIYVHNEILILIGPQLILTKQIAKFLVKPIFLNLYRQQGLYGQGKSGENISFSRWSGRVRESQGIQRKSQEKVGKSQGDFFG